VYPQCVKFQDIQAGSEKGMRLKNLLNDRGDVTTPGDKRSDECVGGVNRLFCTSLETFKTSA
jgi:hypothetical protein